MKYTLLTAACLLMVTWGWARQRDQVKIQRTYEVSGSENFRCYVKNIQGDVEVAAYEGDEITVELTITVFGHSAEDVSKGKSELKLGEYRTQNTLTLAMDAPFAEQYWKEDRLVGQNVYYSPDYDYRYDFVIKLPKGVHLEASTVNEGVILVAGIYGEIEATNVNGHVRIDDAREVRRAHTVNGDVEVSFGANPTKDGSFQTVNGDIVMRFQDGFDADVSGDTMNGDMYTAFDFEPYPARMVVNQGRRRNGTTYRLEEKFEARIGNGGGPDLRFRTLNGNIYLKKI